MWVGKDIESYNPSNTLSALDKQRSLCTTDATGLPITGRDTLWGDIDWAKGANCHMESQVICAPYITIQITGAITIG